MIGRRDSDKIELNRFENNVNVKDKKGLDGSEKDLNVKKWLNVNVNVSENENVKGVDCN